jgi:hypothetical protein
VNVRSARRLRPLVGVVCVAPLMAEGVAAALDGIADTRLLPAELDDVATLLAALGPDAVVVDGECRAARAYAEEQRVPLFVVPVEANPDGDDDASPERLRELVVRSLLPGPARA